MATKSSQAFTNFISEATYNRTLALHACLEEHSWSKRLTQADADAINMTIRELLKISNELYLARQHITSGT